MHRMRANDDEHATSFSWSVSYSSRFLSSLISIIKQAFPFQREKRVRIWANLLSRHSGGCGNRKSSWSVGNNSIESRAQIATSAPPHNNFHKKIILHRKHTTTRAKNKNKWKKNENLWLQKTKRNIPGILLFEFFFLGFNFNGIQFHFSDLINKVVARTQGFRRHGQVGPTPPYLPSRKRASLINSMKLLHKPVRKLFFICFVMVFGTEIH